MSYLGLGRWFDINDIKEAAMPDQLSPPVKTGQTYLIPCFAAFSNFLTTIRRFSIER